MIKKLNTDLVVSFINFNYCNSIGRIFDEVNTSQQKKDKCDEKNYQLAVVPPNISKFMRKLPISSFMNTSIIN